MPHSSHGIGESPKVTRRLFARPLESKITLISNAPVKAGMARGTRSVERTKRRRGVALRRRRAAARERASNIGMHTSMNRAVFIAAKQNASLSTIPI